MIAYQTKFLPADEESKLRKWLSDPALQIMLRVAQSQCAKYGADLMEQFVSQNAHDDSQTRLKENRKHWEKYEAFLTTLEEYARHKEPFETVELTPSSKWGNIE